MIPNSLGKIITEQRKKFLQQHGEGEDLVIQKNAFQREHVIHRKEREFRTYKLADNVGNVEEGDGGNMEEYEEGFS